MSKTPNAVDEYLRATTAGAKPPVTVPAQGNPVDEYLTAAGIKPAAGNPDDMSDLERQVLGLPPKVSHGQPMSFLGGAANAMTLGFGDEVLGGLEALSSQRPYDEALAEVRGKLKGVREANPKTAIAGELIGGLALPFGAAKGATTLVGGVARGAGTGAVAGGITGAGNTEGGLVDRAAGAAWGAGAGAVLGGTVGAVPAAGRAIADLLPLRPGAKPVIPPGVGGRPTHLTARTGAVGDVGKAGGSKSPFAHLSDDELRDMYFDPKPGDFDQYFAVRDELTRRGNAEGLTEEVTRPLRSPPPKKPQPTGPFAGRGSRLGVEDAPDGANVPSVKWNARDLQDEGTVESIRKSFGASTDADVYQTYIPAENLPKARLAGGRTGYGWEELQGRGTPPPVKIRIGKNGSVQILDGNHRIDFWREQGYDHIPAIVIDERSPALRARSGAVDLSGVLRGGEKAYRGAIASTEQRADDMILQSLRRDETSLADIKAMLGSRTGSPKPETIMDLAGDNTRRLARAVRSTVGTGSKRLNETLDERAAGSSQRLVDDLLSTTKTPRENTRKVIEQLAEDRSKEAETLYGKVYDASVDNPNLGAFLKDPAFAKAYERAQRIAAREKDAMPDLDDIVTKDGTLIAPLTVRQLDRIKRGLDDVLDIGKRSPLDAGGLGNEEMAGLRALKNDYLAAIDEAVPDYKVARDAFAGKSAMIRAHDEGKKLLTMNVDEAEGLVESMSASEREAFRKAGIAALADKIDDIKPGHNIQRGVDDRRTDKRRLRLLFDSDEAFDEFVEKVTLEAQMGKTLNFTRGNSQTVDKAAELLDFAGGSIEAIASGGLSSGKLAQMLSRSAAGRLSQGVTERTADALSTRLTKGASGNPNEFLELLQGLTEAEARRAGRATRHGAYTRSTGVQGGLITGKDR